MGLSEITLKKITLVLIFVNILLDFFDHWLNLLLIWINQLFVAVIVSVVVSDSLWPHECQVSLSFTVFQKLLRSYSLSWCWYLIISSSVAPFSFSFILSQHQNLFQRVSSSYCSQSIGNSTSASVLPMNIQDWFPLGLTDLNSLESKGLSRVLQHHNQLLESKHQSLLDNIVSEKE